MPTYLTADEAADELDITKNTLYAYVSRGLIRSEPADASRRTRRYRAEDVHRLKRKKQLQEDPTTAARTALEWGLPVMESALTLIEQGRFYYRGQDACRLAQTHSLEEVAPLLWDISSDDISLDSATLPPHAVPPLDEAEGTILDHMQIALHRAEIHDDRAYDVSKQGLANTGTRLLALLLSLVEEGASPTSSAPIAQRLQNTWGLETPEECALLNTALVLSADHGLNVTAFSVRCVASAGATPYGAINAGLSASRGHRHTGNVARIEALLREAERPDSLRKTMTERLRRGDPVPGFGHRLYPNGDPRAQLLIEQLQTVAPNSSGAAFGSVAAELGADLLGRPPALDFALVALRRALNLPSEAPLLLFVLGRTVGWVGHMIEQYQQGDVIRPRAQYTGPSPEAS